MHEWKVQTTSGEVLDYGAMLWEDGISKQIYIVFLDDEDRDPITNDNIVQEKFALTQSVCRNGFLAYGDFSAAKVEFTVAGIDESLLGHTVGVYLGIEDDADHVLPLGVFTIYEDTLSTDRTQRDCVGYDYMYDVINTDMTEWLETYKQTISTNTYLGYFRNAFFEALGIDQRSDFTYAYTFPADTVSVYKDFIPTGQQVTGDILLHAILEALGMVGYMDNNGEFVYKYVGGNKDSRFVYPSSSTYPYYYDIYPAGRNPVVTYDRSMYREKSLEWSDYEVLPPDGVIVRDGNGAIVYVTNNQAYNPYTVSANVIFNESPDYSVQEKAEKIFNVIQGRKYRPFEMDAIGNPCVEVGDSIDIINKYGDVIESVVMERTLRGIQTMVDEFTTSGTKYFGTYYTGAGTTAQKISGVANKIAAGGGGGGIQVRSVESLPTNPESNVIYLIQGEVVIV